MKLVAIGSPPAAETKKEESKLLWNYIKKNRFLAFSVVAFGLIGWSMLSGTNIFVQQLVDLIVDGNSGSFGETLIFAAVFTTAAGAMYFLSQVVSEKFVAVIGKDIRNDLHDAVMRRSKHDFNTTDTAEYISAVSNDVNTFGSNFKMSLWIVSGSASGISALIIMLLYSVPLTLVAIGCSIIAVLLPIIFSKSMQKRQMNLMENQAAFTVEMKEIYSGHEVISSLNLIKSFKERFARSNESLTNADYSVDFLRAAVTGSGQIFTFASKFIMILVAGFLVMNGAITLGAFTLFVALQSTFSGNVGMVFQIMPIISSMKPVVEKITRYMEYSDDSFTGTKDVTFIKEVEVRGLTFNYNENVPLLEGFTFSIKKNQKIALTGPSGCGKTTLIKLLSGDYASYSGDILYDGVCLRELDREKLRRLITIIHQNTYIFNDSIKNNIMLGEFFTEKAFEEAVCLSGVSKFLPDTAEGLNTNCGEKGVNLSGGQKQRIAIARALIRGAKFLVLDEGVSAVDVETANEIEQELLNIPDLTLLTVTHRIKDGLLDKYDRIVQMVPTPI